MSRGAPLQPDDPRHGTHNGYCNHGCRCEPCRIASSEYMARLRARLPELRKRQSLVGQRRRRELFEAEADRDALRVMVSILAERFR